MDELTKNMALLKRIVFLSVIGVVIGAFVGAIEALFCHGLNFVFEFRRGKEMLLLILMPFVGLCIAYVFLHLAGKSREGMSLVFKVEQGKEKKIPLRLVPVMMGSTWLSHLVGCSVGREGVAVQIGATVSHFFGRYIKFEDSNVIFIVTGIAAGFAGLFGTPITAVFFAMEVLVAGALQYTSLCPAVVAAFVANFVARNLGVLHSEPSLSLEISLDLTILWKVLLMGVCFGLAGQLFSQLLSRFRFVSRMYLKNPYWRIFLMGTILALLFFFCDRGRYSGLGENLIESAINGGTIYAWDWLLKMLFTTLCLTAGFQGGEVTPLFSIGASLGFVLASLLGLPPALGAALGYVAVFGAGTNTFLAPMAIGLEVFGAEYFYFFFLISSISYLFNKNESIYSLQKILKR